MPKHRAGAGFPERPQAMRVVAATGSGGQLCKNAVFSGVQKTFQCLQCLNVKLGTICKCLSLFDKSSDKRTEFAPRKWCSCSISLRFDVHIFATKVQTVTKVQRGK